MAISMSNPMCEDFRHFCRPWLPRWQRILFFCYSQKRVSDQTRIFSTHGFILILTTILSFNNSPPYVHCHLPILLFAIAKKKFRWNNGIGTKKVWTSNSIFMEFFEASSSREQFYRAQLFILYLARMQFSCCFYLIPLRFPSPSLSLRGFI